MKLPQLRYFIGVCSHQSLSATARELGVSQPCISNALAELEREFGLSLFYRHSKRLTLTREGEEFLRCARELCRQADETDALLRRLAGTRPPLRIGIPGRTNSVLGPQLLTAFRRQQPGIPLELVEYPSPQVAQAVAEGALELGIVVFNHPGMERFNRCIFYHTEMQLCLHRSNPLAAQPRLTFSQIGRQPLISLRGGPYSNELFRRHFAQAGLEPNILLHTNQVLTMLRAIQQNLAAGFLFPENAADFPGLCCRPVEGVQPVTVGLIWPKGGTLSSSAADFLHFVGSSAAQTLKNEKAGPV